MADLIAPPTVALVRASLGRVALDAPGATGRGAPVLAIFDAAKSVLAIGAVFEGARFDCRVSHVHFHARVARFLHRLDLGAGGRLVGDRDQISEAGVTNLPAAIGRVELVDECLIVGARFAKFGEATRGHVAHKLVGGKGGRR